MIFLFSISFADDWDRFFAKYDKQQQKIIWKKFEQLKTLTHIRHLRFGLPFFVEEIGQYRVCFIEKELVREILFVGNHKQYEWWYKHYA